MVKKTIAIDGSELELGSPSKDRGRFQRVLQDCVRAEKIDLQCRVLIVGGSIEDVEILGKAGFRDLTLTNLHELPDLQSPLGEGIKLSTLQADAEDMKIADGSFDLVLAHEVLHHCQSPHKALLEMLRLSRRNVIILEPNDSLVMRAFVRLRFSFPYELPAVVANNFQAGGVRNSCIPNYIYRWTPREMYQTAASFIPELEFGLYVRRYWDFNIDAKELALRTQTRIGSFTKLLGPNFFLSCLHAFQAVVNRLPWLGGQGNKFFGCITRQDNLKPWLVRTNGELSYNRNYEKP